MNFYDFLKLVLKTVTKTKPGVKRKTKKRASPEIRLSFYISYVRGPSQRTQVFDLDLLCPSAVCIQGTLTDRQ